MSYTPRPGTVAYRALAHLETIRTQERTATQIAEALGGGINGSEVAASLAPAISAGAVFRRQRDKTSPRAPQWYSLTDMERHTREFRPNPAGWLERPAVFKAHEGTGPTRMADAGPGVGERDTPKRPPQPTVTNLLGHPLADARSKASRAAMEAIAIAPNSQRHESGAQPGGDAGTMAHNTEHAAPLGGLAEGEGATAPSPGLREAKADEGRPGTTPSRGRIDEAQFRSPLRTINRKNAGSAVDPDWPVADRLLPGDYLVHKRSGIELVYGEGELQPSRVSVPNDGAKFALWCDGELTLFVGDTELTLNPAQVQRLRRLLGGGA